MDFWGYDCYFPQNNDTRTTPAPEGENPLPMRRLVPISARCLPNELMHFSGWNNVVCVNRRIPALQKAFREASRLRPFATSNP